MSEPSREKQPEIGSKEWEANREREIRELRQKERREAAEYRQKKEAGLLSDTPALSKLVAAASKKRPPRLVLGGTLASLSILIAIVGFAVFGGMYLEIPAVIVALYAVRKREGRAAWIALLISLACLAGTSLFSFIIGRFF